MVEKKNKIKRDPRADDIDTMIEFLESEEINEDDWQSTHFRINDVLDTDSNDGMHSGGTLTAEIIINEDDGFLQDTPQKNWRKITG